MKQVLLVLGQRLLFAQTEQLQEETTPLSLAETIPLSVCEMRCNPYPCGSVQCPGVVVALHTPLLLTFLLTLSLFLSNCVSLFGCARDYTLRLAVENLEQSTLT